LIEEADHSTSNTFYGFLSIKLGGIDNLQSNYCSQKYIFLHQKSIKYNSYIYPFLYVLIFEDEVSNAFVTHKIYTQNYLSKKFHCLYFAFFGTVFFLFTS
jgi:hypothetical protein